MAVTEVSFQITSWLQTTVSITILIVPPDGVVRPTARFMVLSVVLHVAVVEFFPSRFYQLFSTVDHGLYFVGHVDLEFIQLVAQNKVNLE